MLVKASLVRQCDAVGGDGTLGEIDDLYFDEFGWRVCYFVVATGDILAGKRSLAPLSYLESANWTAKRLSMRMSKQGLLDEPLSDLDHDVASQFEKHNAGYVAWPPPTPTPEGSTSQVPLGEPHHPGTDDEGKPLLRSAKEISGYVIEASDGRCGHLEDLLIDDKRWTVESLLIDPRNLLPGTLRLVPASMVDHCEWLSHSVRMNVGKQQIRNCPAYETQAAIDDLVSSG